MMYFVVQTYCLEIQSGLPTFEPALIMLNNGKLDEVNFNPLHNCKTNCISQKPLTTSSFILFGHGNISGAMYTSNSMRF